MSKFLLVWFGQTVSIFGSNLAGFALGIAVFQWTHSISWLGIISFATLAPQIVLAPVAGALVDRVNRRTLMLVGHAGGALCSLTMLAAHSLGVLRVPLVVAAVSMASVFWCIQSLAFRAAITSLAPKNMLVRASGMVELSFGMSQLAAPMLAAVALAKLGVFGVLLLDALSFGVAMASVSSVAFPPFIPATSAHATLVDTMFGWGYVKRRPGLVLLMVLLAMMNFNFGAIEVLLTPLVLSFADVATLGAILSTGGIGMVLGSSLMILWQGPGRRFRAILVGIALQGAILLTAASNVPSTWLVGAATFAILFVEPIVHTLSAAIMQQEVEPEALGRVFALRQLVVFGPVPLGALAAGPLVERCLRPWFALGTIPALLMFFGLLGALSAAAAVATSFSKLASFGDREESPACPS